MRKARFGLSAASFIFLLHATAQNTSPYWSLAGNSNATSSTNKLGTTNAYPLRITTNSSTRIYISPSAGYVGVGTTSPSARLHVNAVSGTSPLKVAINGATKLYINSSGGLSVGSGSTPPSNGLYVAGNAGIGTTTPAAKLHVVGRGRFTTGVTVNNGSIVDTATASGAKAIYGLSTGEEGYGVHGDGTYGVYGTGIYGVWGNGLLGVEGDGEIGVLGIGDGSDGVRGETSSEEVNGVAGYASGANANGIYGASDKGYAGFFDGSVYTTGSYLPSDRTLKQHIADFQSAMALLAKLQPKTYEYRQDGDYKLMHLPEGTRYGFIAQDVEQVLPSLVKATWFHTHNPKHLVKPPVGAKTVMQTSESIGFKALNYNELIPIMIKGMQEQQQENEALKARIEKLEALVSRLASNQAGNAVTSLSSLEQNTPNPVRGTTSIRYHIQEGSTSALLNLTNAKGQLVKTIAIQHAGTGQINLNAGLLAAGTYNYTLYVDGKQMDSKRLVIAR